MTRSRGLGAAVALLLLATGCAGPRGGFGDRLPEDSVDVCAAVLPLALQSVGGQGRLVAVRPLARGQGAELLRQLGDIASPQPTPTASPSTQTKGCAVAYEGSYDSSILTGAVGGAGRYAVVLVRVRHPEVRALVVTDTLPPRLRD